MISVDQHFFWTDLRKMFSFDFGLCHFLNKRFPATELVLYEDVHLIRSQVLFIGYALLQKCKVRELYSKFHHKSLFADVFDVSFSGDMSGHLYVDVPEQLQTTSIIQGEFTFVRVEY